MNSLSFRRAAMFITGCAISGALHAQSETAQLTTIPASVDGQSSSCSVRQEEGIARSVESGATLFALCGGRVALLGEADEYSAVVNEELGAVLVDLRRHGTRRVLMVSLQGEGRPLLLEDVSGQIAMEAGKGPMSSIDDVEIEIAGFAAEGTITVQGGAGEEMLPLAQQVAEARAYRAIMAED